MVDCQRHWLITGYRLCREETCSGVVGDGGGGEGLLNNIGSQVSCETRIG